MRRRLAGLVLAFGLGALVGGLAGVFIFIRTVGGSGEASVPISAPTLSLAMLTTTPAAPPIDSAAMATQVALIATSVQQLAEAQPDERLDELTTQVAAVSQRIEQITVAQVVPATVTLPPTHTPQPTLTSTPTPAPLAALDGQRLYRIVPEESQARFILDELEPLRNNLVGSTDQVAGDFIVDFANPANSRIGVIRFNMLTFRTDSGDRDRVIRGEIFQSDRSEYEFSDFTPQTVTGLPESIEQGQTVTFQVTGDFPIRGVTHSFTFDVTVTITSPDELRGLAHTIINRSDYGLLQFFLADHGVSEEITLELEFVARAVEGSAELVMPTLTATPAPQQVFRIVPEESEASFQITENNPNGSGTVTTEGSTDQIAGDILVDFEHPDRSQVGTIRINVRTLHTDNEERDNIIRGMVLRSEEDAYEFSNFVPNALTGLPEHIDLGQTITFEMTGDLTLRGTTQSVTFQAIVTLVSRDELRGSAQASIQRADFGMMDTPLTNARVSEAVILRINLVARAVSE